MEGREEGGVERREEGGPGELGRLEGKKWEGSL